MQFKDQCSRLERQISELISVMEGREFEFVEVVKKLGSLEEECAEGRVVVVQLRADLKNSEDLKSITSEKVNCTSLCFYDFGHTDCQ